MAPEILLLALASTIRPTSLAAISALLTQESRRRLLLVYVIAGLAFTFAFGVAVVGVFHGIHLDSGGGHTPGAADVIGGLVALAVGIGVLTGRIRRRTPSSERSRWAGRLDRRVTVSTAAIAGPLTHIPGIFYLIALNVIVAQNAGLPGGVVAVAIYDLIWFAVPIAAVVLCTVDPDAARGAVATVQIAARQHARTIIGAVSLVVGIALLIRGALAL